MPNCAAPSACPFGGQIYSIMPHQILIPITIITGFLGAGKTRFLSQLLASPDMQHTLVVINEFGEFSLDHLLVENVTAQTSEQIFELPNGCLCCSAQGELVEKLASLIEQKQAGTLNFNRLMIETSGVTDTKILVENLWKIKEIRQSFSLSKVITLISALEWSQSQAQFNEVSQQLAISDVILVSKSDLLPAKTRDQELANLISEIELNGAAVPVHVLPLEIIQLHKIGEIDEKKQVLKSVTNNNRAHSQIYKTFVLRTNIPVSESTIEGFMNTLLSKYPNNLLRVKGLVYTIENSQQPLVVQAVKSTLSPLTWLTRWSAPPSTYLTVIHTGNVSTQITALFEGYLNIPKIDQPDKAALSDNPLSITGVGKFQ